MVSVNKSHSRQHRSDHQGQKEAGSGGIEVSDNADIKDRAAVLAMVTGPHSLPPAHSSPAPQTQANWL